MRLVDVLCDLCREIHTVHEDGTKSTDSLEDIYGGYTAEKLIPSKNPAAPIVISSLLLDLKRFGGCKECITSLERRLRM